MEALARVFKYQGDFARAEPLYLHGMEIERQISGQGNSSGAAVLTELADLYLLTGRYAAAEQREQESLKIVQKAWGDRCLAYAGGLSRIGVLKALRHVASEGVPGSSEALRIFRTHLEENAASQSERQQLGLRNAVGSILDNYLFVTGEAHVPAEQVYAEILNWKGIVGALQQQMRQLQRRLQQSGNKEVARLAVNLEEATGELAALSRSTGVRDADRRFRLEELSGRIESLQAQLAGASDDYRRQLDQHRHIPPDLREALPAEAVLVDFFSYSHFGSAAEGGDKIVHRSDLAVFIVGPNQPTARVELGPVEPIEKAIAKWRERFGRRGTEGDPGAELRRLVWQPLEEHLGGAKTVLISPNGLTAPIAWCALPGRQPGRFLIDELEIATIPIPGQLPELVRSAERQDVPEKPSLLTVGDVDFGADPGRLSALASNRSAPRGDHSFNWPSLPGTRDEVTAINASFVKRFSPAAPIELLKDQATKSAVRDAAARCQYLHVSTHGFFAPPQIRSALSTTTPSNSATGTDSLSGPTSSGFDPGLLSGLVLAGANRPPENGKEDGILTALEVEEMDLSRVRLATLSACETGLGETAGGEGLLGLQRAFQTAGAKTVVASLWKVPDRATQLLMARFYDNLWQKRMTKLEASARPNSGCSTRGRRILTSQGAWNSRPMSRRSRRRPRLCLPIIGLPSCSAGIGDRTRAEKAPMQTEPTKAERPKHKRRGFQFSLRT